MQTFVIVGASLAGAKAAETLRSEGFAGKIVLLGAESERPYERPPLSKDYLRGESERDAAYVHEAGYYEEHDIELRLGTRAVSLDASKNEISIESGESLAYDALLLATGAEPRRLPIPGADLDGVHLLRTMGDSDALRGVIDGGGHLVVVGAGWIGCEVAASARQKGMDVTIVEPMSVPLERVLGPELGAIYRDVHADQGVNLRLGSGVEGFEGDGRVERVRTSDGQTIDCSAVVVGVGVKPRIELAESAGLDTGDGVHVDERLRTSAPNVFAAGDIASHQHPFYGERVRVEHWGTALEQGPAAARAMLGNDAPYERLPYFFSDQYDVGMEYAGFAPRFDRVVFRGDTAAREFIAFWIDGDRVVAGMNVNVWDVNDAIQALIRSRASVDDGRLSDPDVSLESLAGEEAAAS
jgi:3-phenylpropionate/trans-cinnamate dioxygenase ferredoxin reductase component